MEPSKSKIGIWLKASRLQMQPLLVLPVLLGCLIAWWESGVFSWGKYLLGQGIVTLLLLATTYANECADYQADRLNRTYARFSGGSRVLVEGLIARSTMLKATWITLMVAGLLTLVLAVKYGVSGPVLALILFGAIAGIEYSLPPLRLVYRGLGELTVTLSNSFLPLLFGYWLQAGLKLEGLPWLLTLPLAAIVFGGITLSQFPDYPSDEAAGKRTLAVKFGKARMFKASALSFVCGYILVLAYLVFGAVNPLILGLILLSIPLAGRLIWLLLRARGDDEENLELLGGLAISLTLWFCAASILALLILSF